MNLSLSLSEFALNNQLGFSSVVPEFLLYIIRCSILKDRLSTFSSCSYSFHTIYLSRHLIHLVFWNYQVSSSKPVSLSPRRSVDYVNLRKGFQFYSYIQLVYLDHSIKVTCRSVDALLRRILKLPNINKISTVYARVLSLTQYYAW